MDKDELVEKISNDISNGEKIKKLMSKYKVSLNDIVNSMSDSGVWVYSDEPLFEICSIIDEKIGTKKFMDMLISTISSKELLVLLECITHEESL